MHARSETVKSKVEGCPHIASKPPFISPGIFSHNRATIKIFLKYNRLFWLQSYVRTQGRSTICICNISRTYGESGSCGICKLLLQVVYTRNF